MAQRTTAELVREIRDRSGLTQEALARELGVSFATVNAWERGRSRPRPAHVEALHERARQLGITMGITVLLIDDDPIACAVIENQLMASSLPVTVLTADNGSIGLVLCGMHRPDLILLDLLMPGIDGVEVSRRLGHIDGLERTEVVFITAASDPELLEAARGTGNRVFVKPITEEDLEGLVIGASAAVTVPLASETV